MKIEKLNIYTRYVRNSAVHRLLPSVFILIRRFAFIFGRQHRFLYWYAGGIDMFL